MLEIIETLLVLQDRDRTIVQGRAEIVGLEIERVSDNDRSPTAAAAQAGAGPFRTNSLMTQIASAMLLLPSLLGSHRMKSLTCATAWV